MALFEQISEDIKKAMLARNKVELEALRGIKKELLEAKTSKENAGELTDAAAIKVIQKMAKQGKDTAEVFAAQGRQDLADEYLAQVEVYNKYLPQMMSDDIVVVFTSLEGATWAILSTRNEIRVTFSVFPSTSVSRVGFSDERIAAPFVGKVVTILFTLDGAILLVILVPFHYACFVPT